MDKTCKLFISHSSKDADYVEVFINLLEVLGLSEEQIICSSIPPYCIPLEGKVYEWLVNEFQQSSLHVLYFFSEDYYDSVASLNEMGATWAMKHKWTGFLLPGFSFDKLEGCIDKTQISIKLDDTDRRTLNYRLREFKEKIINEFSLRPISIDVWERHKDDFLERISVLANSRQDVYKEESDDITPNICVKKKIENVSMDSVFLLVYAAAECGYIFKTTTLDSPTQIAVGSKKFMKDNSQRESVRWQAALENLLRQGWVQPVGGGREIFQVTDSGYNNADWLEKKTGINIQVEPLDELQRFDC